MVSNRELVQLPNGDLWRGHDRNLTREDNVDKTNAPRPFAKIDEAMSAILKNAKGHRDLTCLWCGLQSGDKEMREHLKKDHASVVNPPSDEQLIMATKLNQVSAESTE